LSHDKSAYFSLFWQQVGREPFLPLSSNLVMRDRALAHAISTFESPLKGYEI